MAAIIIKYEDNIIDLTEEAPFGTDTSEDDVVIIDEPIVPPHLLSSGRRAESTESDVEIVENVPPVACHFFYPNENEEEREGGGVTDPLAPTPEWVDCSTLQTEQVTVDDELLALETSPESTSSNFDFVDPLRPTVPIKTEPVAEVDVKPSISELSKMMCGTTNINGFELVSNIHPEIKQEIPNDESNFETNSKKRKNSEEIYENNLMPPKKAKTGIKFGIKCGPLSTKNRLSKEKKSSNIHSKCDSNDFSSSKGLQPELNNYSDLLKNVIVNIGPKLPLPGCFRLKQRLLDQSLETIQCKDDTQLENNTKEHIVLKIYTCSRCNHKCTDPLFHEAHMEICSSKRHINSLNSSQPDSSDKSLNLAVQESIKKDGFYRCNICLFKFKHQENLIVHLNQHSTDGFVCYICDLNFFTLDQLRQHMLDDHKNLEKIFSCNVCQYSSMKIHHIKEHMIKHNSDKYLYCSRCKQNFEDKDDFEKHKLNYHKNSKTKNGNKSTVNINEEFNVKNLKDNKIGFNSEINKDNEMSEIREIVDSHLLEIKMDNNSFSETKMFNEDVDFFSLKRAFEDQIIIRDGIYQCNGCIYKFIHRENLIKHKKLHLKNKPFSCPACSFQSLSVIDFSKHMRNHPRCEITCKECFQTFKEVNSLSEHSVRHIDDGLYCYQCRKNLETVAIYNKHMTVKHGNSAKYTCSECSFRTHMAFSLKRHMSRHKQNCTESSIVKESGNENDDSNKNISSDPSCDEVKYTVLNCTMCNLRFNSAIALAEHNAVTHERPDSVIVKNQKRELKCKKCSFQCLQIAKFLEHMTNHNFKQEQKPFICNVCSLKTIYPRCYLNHMKSHSSSDGVLECNLCQFKCKKDVNFTNHIRIHLLKYCPLCDFKSLQLYKLKCHVLSAHKERSKHVSVSNSKIQSNTKKPNLIVYKKENLSKKAVSFTLNRAAKCHACCFCPYRSYRMGDLKRHVARHFSGESFRNHKLGYKIKKPVLTEKSKENKSSKITKEPVRGVSKVASTVRKGVSSTLYRCSQCGYKSQIKTNVYQHLTRTHNIGAGHRNQMIELIHVRLPRTKQNITKADFEDSKTNLNQSVIDKYFLPESDSKIATQPVENVSKLSTTETTDIELQLYRCSKCGLESDRRETIARHCVKVHNITGGVRNRMIERVYQKTSHTDDEETKSDCDTVGVNNSPIMNDNCLPDSDLNIAKEADVSKLPKKEMTDVANIIYCCSQCEYQKKDRKSVSQHLIKIHNIIGGVRNHRIIKVYQKTSHTDDEETKSDCDTVELNNSPIMNDNCLPDSDLNIAKEADVSKLSKTEMTDIPNIFYRCSQCEYQKKKRDSVSQHLIKIHNIIGGLRNHMIKKVYQKTSHTDDEETKSDCDTVELNNSPIMNDNCLPDSDLNIAKEADVSKLPKTEMTDVPNIFYRCSQCEYQKKKRDSVSNHLINIHNIRGGLRNHMIKKVYARTLQTENRETKPSCGNMGINTKGAIINGNFSLKADAKVMQSENIKKFTASSTIKKKTKGNSRKQMKNSLIKCTSCNVQKLSLLAQLQHKKLGHSIFWNKSFSCKYCGYRCADKGNMIKHQKWKHPEVKKEEDSSDCSKNLGLSSQMVMINKTSDGQDFPKSYQSVRMDEEQNSVSEIGNRKHVIKCSECNILQLSRFAQVQHEKLGHDAFWTRPFSCDICGYRCNNKGAFVKHKASHRIFKDGGSEKDSLGLVCNNPSVPQDEKGGIKGMKYDYDDDDENYVCGECDYTTTDVVDFTTHMFIHSGIPDD